MMMIKMIKVKKNKQNKQKVIQRIIITIIMTKKRHMMINMAKKTRDNQIRGIILMMNTMYIKKIPQKNRQKVILLMTLMKKIMIA